MFKWLKIAVSVPALALCCGVFPGARQALAVAAEDLKPQTGEAVATFAGGCFWCIEADFAKFPGVNRAISGYSGGQKANPSYEEVSSGRTGHLETVQIFYDTSKVSFEDLLNRFWKIIDPTDPAGQFADKGSQYASAIFYHDEAQRQAAENSKRKLAESGKFDKPIATQIRPYENFYPAEDYHQKYFQTNAQSYKFYRQGSGRDRFLEKTWGAGQPPEPQTGFVKPGEAELKAKLTPLQFEVTQKEGTEPPFNNEYNANKRPGIYVDIVSGEPLFSSLDKYDSGTGWPSFTQPLEPDKVELREDRKLFSVRTEVRGRLAGTHLGHVFPDGPPPTGKRYCLNSAALRFVPLEDLEKEGLGRYAKLFQEQSDK